VARTTPLFSNFLFTNLFSIKFLYFLIISSLILTCSCQYSYNLMLTSNCMCRPSCGTALPLLSLVSFLIFADHRATDFTLSKTFENAQWKSCPTFLQIVVMKSCARTVKHIYFASLDIYLHSSILSYLSIFISSSLS
jgi:hypothetical protein